MHTDFVSKKHNEVFIIRANQNISELKGNFFLSIVSSWEKPLQPAAPGRFSWLFTSPVRQSNRPSLLQCSTGGVNWFATWLAKKEQPSFEHRGSHAASCMCESFTLPANQRQGFLSACAESALDPI